MRGRRNSIRKTKTCHRPGRKHLPQLIAPSHVTIRYTPQNQNFLLRSQIQRLLPQQAWFLQLMIPFHRQTTTRKTRGPAHMTVCLVVLCPAHSLTVRYTAVPQTSRQTHPPAMIMTTSWRIDHHGTYLKWHLFSPSHLRTKLPRRPPSSTHHLLHFSTLMMNRNVPITRHPSPKKIYAILLTILCMLTEMKAQYIFMYNYATLRRWLRTLKKTLKLKNILFNH